MSPAFPESAPLILARPSCELAEPKLGWGDRHTFSVQNLRQQAPKNSVGKMKNIFKQCIFNSDANIERERERERHIYMYPVFSTRGQTSLSCLLLFCLLSCQGPRQASTMWQVLDQYWAILLFQKRTLRYQWVSSDVSSSLLEFLGRQDFLSWLLWSPSPSPVSSLPQGLIKV